MPRYDPKKVRGNFGPGSFSDQYDNNKMRSVDRDQHIGGVTGIPFEDDIDLDDMRFAPERGETNLSNQNTDLHEPSRDADLGKTGTNWNWDIHLRDFSGKGPKGWKLSDERLKERVCEVLLHSHEVDPSELDVKVEDRVVYLKGNIKSKGMRRVAEDLVESIPGVEDVFTELKIKDTSNFQLSPKALDEARNTDQS